MELRKSDNLKSITPSSNTKRLVEKVMNGNSNCDSPFRFLPNFSTPPSRLLKIKNPFDSPLRDRLHLPICSPGLFAKSTPKKEDKFKWSICDISNLKPAEIEATSSEDHIHYVDPSVESQIQEKISSFFSQHSVVPSPLSQDTEAIGNVLISDTTPDSRNRKAGFNHAATQTNICLGALLPKQFEEALRTYENLDIPKYTCDIKVNKNQSYLPEDVYYKKLFGSESPSPSAQSSPAMSTGDSPLQFSPLKELEICEDPSFSRLDKRQFNEWALSPITPEDTNTPLKDQSSYMSVRESKSACRLIFSDNMSLDRSASNVVPDVLDPVSVPRNCFEETIKTPKFEKADNSDENWDMEYNHISMVAADYEEGRMDISLSRTPKTGLFVSPRKRLSDSFKDLHAIWGHSERRKPLEQVDIVKSRLMSEGSSDMGYYSGSGLSAPSLNDNTWHDIHVIASTPTKKKV